MSDFFSQQIYVEKVKQIVSTLSQNLQRPLKVSVVTFGCQQNEADSERLLGTALELGYQKADTLEQSDLIIYNTCAVREHAELRALSKTGQLKHLKKANENLIVGLWGCMVSQESRVQDIKTKYPYVDFVAGTNMLHRLSEILCDVLTTKKRRFYVDNQNYPIVEGVPVSRQNDVCASVSIMYGCDNFCTYCIVPYVRGRERSRKPQDIIDEVTSLVNNGYKEITLLGQNVNSYGKGLCENEKIRDFASLIEALSKIDGDFVIRFMTSHPKDVSDRLIEVISQNPKIERHFHLPLQSGSNSILKAMNRKYTREKYLETVNKLKSNVPDIVFTTDIIVGFPGETEQDFEDTLKTLSQVGFDAVFSFIYSKRPGTPAEKYEDVNSHECKTQRMSRLIELQRNCVLDANKKYVGKTVRVLCDQKVDQNGLYAGKTSGFKLVKFPCERNVYGQFVDVEIDSYVEAMLLGKVK